MRKNLFQNDSKGASVIEYVLLASLIILIAVAVIRRLGNNISSTFIKSSDHVATAFDSYYANGGQAGLNDADEGYDE